MHQKYLVTDEWRIIEDKWDPERHESSESIFSIGNGRMGQRANFEEAYTGTHLQGSYIGGVYYPDKTRVGWWKNGYPEYFAKVLNSVNWIGIDLEIDGVVIDLARLEVLDFYRELDMRSGILSRKVKLALDSGREVLLETERFISMERKELGAISFAVKLLNFSGNVVFRPYLDFDVINSDSNYEEKFWEAVSENVGSQKAVLSARTKKLDFQVAAAMRYDVYEDKNHLNIYPDTEKHDKYVCNSFSIEAREGAQYRLFKYAGIVSSLNHQKSELEKAADKVASDAMRTGYEALRAEHSSWWHNYWEGSDIEISGDPEAQQGIRFNIFQLVQTYTGDDPRLNIGPKGFTGEKYGGSTYWDTEAYCLPFYMASAGQEVAKNLLVYRYRHLQKAIENAEKLGFSGGAALYPMVTMNGEECHNEWEITFEEIHRNGAIAFAIYNYIRYYGDEHYLTEYGLEVLIGIARFWAQRFNWSDAKKKYVMLGVTGPNEYENNVNNNWYTSFIAQWTLRYTAEAIRIAGKIDPERQRAILEKVAFQESGELKNWQAIVDNVFLPYDPDRGIFLQQEGYLDKEQVLADELNPEERPINQHWSWDRILRSCFIKQADVLQGMYLFEGQFTRDELERNFDYYEPRTVHESSLSPCVHAILAASLGKLEKAYEMYLRTSRLDLDDYNREVSEGLHITSMAGTWLSVIEGFGGMRVRNGVLHFQPRLPKHWDRLGFKIHFRNSIIQVVLSESGNEIKHISGDIPEVMINDQRVSPV